jgi:formylglycine-generating enzyme required for sulfatase activity
MLSYAVSRPKIWTSTPTTPSPLHDSTRRDQARRRGMCQESLRVCMTCGQKKEGSNMFCLRCQAEYAERVKEATGGPEASDIEAPGTGLPQAIVPFDWSQAMEYQRATAEFLGLPVDRAIDLGQGVFLHMKLVPAGEFYRCGRFRSYRVRLTRPFYLGIYPVTQAQFEAVMGTNPSERKGADKPVVTVPLDDIETFCARLSQRSDLEVGLPTEAQREYACRAGTTSFFSFGDYVEDLSDYAWYHDNSDALPPVGKKKPNAFGFYDMHGSVHEWCQDRENWDDYWKLDDSYSGGLKIDPVGCTGSYRVTCGGTWLSNASECGSAMRGLVLPIHKSFLAGFRVAAVLPVPA